MIAGMNDEEIKEHHDTEKEVKQKVSELAKMIKESKHCVIHTGAGISTSAGIPDFRGPNGVWTCRDQKRALPRGKRFKEWRPTYCHMAIVELLNQGLIKHLVSQNVDGLHVRSGIPLEKISELHGNTHKEYCSKCGKEYFRLFETRNAYSVTDHRTGRKCDICGGMLFDSIINFGENLPKNALDKAFKESTKSDLCIVFGSSMRVSPANSLPVIPVKQKKGKLVLVNYQKTPIDKHCTMIIHSATDLVMELLMNELDIKVPDWEEKLTEIIEEQEQELKKKSEEKSKEKPKEKSKDKSKDKSKEKSKEKSKDKSKEKPKDKPKEKPKEKEKK